LHLNLSNVMSAVKPTPFADRHIGPSATEIAAMLKVIGLDSLDQLIYETVPDNIRIEHTLDLPPALTEQEYLTHMRALASKNKLFTNFIGMGYSGTITPPVIQRNLFENPGWYTQYTPYQAEIAQGRLESLLNFQTMISDLTGLPIANASLLDEGTAAAEAMAMFFSERNKRQVEAPIFLVSDHVLPHTIDVVQARAEPIGIRVKVGPITSADLSDNVFGMLLQYPGKSGALHDERDLVAAAREKGIYVTVACDLLALALLSPPGEWGADCVVGNSQRFGVPMGFGGPHAAFFATRDEFKRQIPGRIIGMSVDRHGNPALRMALQTREQHIRREKATSNICTAQALLANMAAMYAVYHGPEGIRKIAARVHQLTCALHQALTALGLSQVNKAWFDTLRIEMSPADLRKIRQVALRMKMNFFYDRSGLQISLDETHRIQDVEAVTAVFASFVGQKQPKISLSEKKALPTALARTSEYLTHPVFNQYHTETQLMRYLKRLENKDLSLVHSMIALGSCTMKLNAAAEMMPVSWPEWGQLHPFAPAAQTRGYQQLFEELEAYLCKCTGFEACSLQPNSGAQGEYSGLLCIRAYHKANGDKHRNVVLIPSSAHGTNPASAAMIGARIVIVECDERGNIDVEDLRRKAEQHAANLSALMVTYPSTHGVFESAIVEVCDIIHKNGGLVYMDGANMNAQVGLTNPARIGADVCHLNLHKTFAIPHGGGGPGMGPICVNAKLAPFLPGHRFARTGGRKAIKAVSAAPWGSASILLISYAYIRMLGARGVTDASIMAILNANYIKARLESEYKVLYVGERGRAAHELIVDLRPFKAFCSAEDVAKRLIDYGFHAPTLSFPVAGTIMIEPTESESRDELDRFCDAMLAIKQEIDEVARGDADAQDNVLVNAPHTVDELTADVWTHPYDRQKAGWPLPWLREGFKFWPTVARVNNAFGDRNLVCTCPPIEMYREEV
jgi:glycine dehydrogenase